MQARLGNKRKKFQWQTILANVQIIVKKVIYGCVQKITKNQAGFIGDLTFSYLKGIRSLEKIMFLEFVLMCKAKSYVSVSAVM